MTVVVAMPPAEATEETANRCCLDLTLLDGDCGAWGRLVVRAGRISIQIGRSAVPAIRRRTPRIHRLWPSFGLLLLSCSLWGPPRADHAMRRAPHHLGSRTAHDAHRNRPPVLSVSAGLAAVARDETSSCPRPPSLCRTGLPKQIRTSVLTITRYRWDKKRTARFRFFCAPCREITDLTSWQRYRRAIDAGVNEFRHRARQQQGEGADRNALAAAPRPKAMRSDFSSLGVIWGVRTLVPLGEPAADADAGDADAADCV